MQLDQVTVRIRPRLSWEAMDLGLRLIQQYWKAIYIPWLILIVPIFVLLNTVLADHMWIAAVVFWWLKPVYDRLVLTVLSRSLFNEVPDWRDTLRSLPAAMKNGLFLQLTLFRFDPSRSFRLPVMQLEGLKGKQRSERMRVLQARTATNSGWLIVGCIHLEIALNVALFGLLYMFLPQSMDIGFMSPFFEETPPYWADLLSNLFYAISLSIIEPMYVAAGFMLYINRRTHLEGWDIELAFRRMAQRLRQLASTGAAALILVPALLMTLPYTADAKSVRPASDAAEVIDEVLAHEDFATSRTEEQWRLHDLDWDMNFDEDEEDLDLDAPEWIDAFASGVKAAVIVTVIGVILYILYRYRHEIAALRGPPRTREEAPPEAILGMDIRPDSLPDDVADAAARLWGEKRYRDALGLLYRAAVSHMLHHDDVSIIDGDTEEDILRSASLRLDAKRLDYLRLLTRSWQTIAYAHRVPDGDSFEQLVFCWSEQFNRDSEQA